MNATAQRIQDLEVQNVQIDAGNAVLRDLFKDRPATLQALDALERENHRRLMAL